MNILLFLIPVSMLALGVALWFFIWAVKRGQFEDLDTPALDILRDDEHDRPPAARRVPAPPAAAADSPSPAVPAPDAADGPHSDGDGRRGPQD